MRAFPGESWVAGFKRRYEAGNVPEEILQPVATKRCAHVINLDADEDEDEADTAVADPPPDFGQPAGEEEENEGDAVAAGEVNVSDEELEEGVAALESDGRTPDVGELRKRLKAMDAPELRSLRPWHRSASSASQ